MSWEHKAILACRKRGLKVVDYGFQGGWVFAIKEEDINDNIFPIAETTIAGWMKEDNNVYHSS